MPHSPRMKTGNKKEAAHQTSGRWRLRDRGTDGGGGGPARGRGATGRDGQAAGLRSHGHVALITPRRSTPSFPRSSPHVIPGCRAREAGGPAARPGRVSAAEVNTVAPAAPGGALSRLLGSASGCPHFRAVRQRSESGPPARSGRAVPHPSRTAGHPGRAPEKTHVGSLCLAESSRAVGPKFSVSGSTAFVRYCV